VLGLARRVNPDVAARKSRLTAANANVKYARTAYLPTLQVSTGYRATSLAYTDANILANQKAASVFGSFTNCMFLDSLRAGSGLPREDCGTGIATEAQLAAARSSNNPFSFNRVPLGVQFFLSVPIFNGFAREANIEQNKVLRDNAENDVRARNLQLTTDVTQAYLTLVTQAQTVELQTQTAAKAAEDLALQEESFKVGARTFLDVSTARATYEQAQINRVNAIYEYHKAFAALENAIGRPLR
jgi:outer membrane protein